MNTLQRYDCGDETDPSMCPRSDGDYVLFDEHEDIVADLQAEIDRLNDLYNTALGVIAQLEMEVTIAKDDVLGFEDNATSWGW